MCNLRSIVLNISITITIIIVLVAVVFDGQSEVTYGHFFGATKTTGNYQVIFAPSPSTPIAGDNSTSLNFSILQNNANIYNVYVAMIVTEKQSGDIIGHMPYRFHEFSDI